MRASESSRKILHWIKQYDFSKHVFLKRTQHYMIIEFDVRTTKTRASTIVTRLKLLVWEISEKSDICVSKELTSAPPKSRGELASWRIFTTIPVRKHASMSSSAMKEVA